MEYTIVIGDTLMDLKNVVNQFLVCDWEPQGSVTYDPYLKTYMQALVRELKDGAKKN